MKSIENKIGRDLDPLHKHQYFKDILKFKNQKFFKLSTEFVKVGNDRKHETTYFGTLCLNKSKTHSNERAPVQDFEFAPTADPKDSNNSKKCCTAVFFALLKFQ